MKKLLIILLALPLFSACTLLDVESTKTEHTTSRDNERYIEKLEGRIEILEERIRELEKKTSN